MTRSVLSAPHFHHEAAAYKFVEARIWPNGPVCPHCGSDRAGKLGGKSTRIGTYKCYNGKCRKPFTVKVDTIFHDSHVKLHIWLQAIFLLCSSKKGISANQLHRTLGVTLKTAWFMAHRIREAMKIENEQPLGGWGEIVEADETFWSRKKGFRRHKSGFAHKMKILSLVERGGKVRSVVINRLTHREIGRILKENIKPHTALRTDAATHYRSGIGFPNHQTVNHDVGEYVRGDAHTNTLEGYFSIFKRGMRGIYQHCDEKHLHRYIAEYDFRYNGRKVDDSARAESALRGIVGRRLTYRDSSL